MPFMPSPILLSSPRGRRLTGAGVREQWPPAQDLPSACRVAIIGGGPAAVALATNVFHRWGHLRDVAVIDSHGSLMGRFFARVDTLRQPVLRSPYEHHVGTHEHRDCELLDFARCRWAALTDVERGEIRMAMSGQRSVVPVDVFRAYAGHTVANHGIASRCWKSTVEQVHRDGGAWTVRHTGGTLRAERVVLAIGEQVNGLPADWVVSDRVVRWDHFRHDRPGRMVLVSGAGLSAAHMIAELCSSGSHVVWVQRRPERYQCADVNARFFRPEGRASFRSQPIQARARSLINHRRPSIMFEFRPLLRRWAEQGCLSIHRHTTVTRIRERPDGRLLVMLSDGATRPVDQVIAAHGTSPAALPVDGLRFVLPNLPILDDDTLEPAGAAGLHVIGAHAGMSVGPAARNIDGMRVAARLIADAIDRRNGRAR